MTQDTKYLVFILLFTYTKSHSLEITGTANDFKHFPIINYVSSAENITLYNYNQHYNGNDINNKLRRLNAWKTINYVFPSEADKQNAISSGIYNPNRLVPIGIAAAKNKVFLTVPVFYIPTRNPASLVYYELPSSTISPDLKPYPDWSWHDRDTCNDIVSAIRMKIDECERMWLLDTGLYGIFSDNYIKICPPKIMVFDTNNNQLLFKVEIPDEFVQTASILASIEVEFTSQISCGSGFVNNAVIYLSDVTIYNLIVVDLSKPINEQIWIIKDKSFYPVPTAGSFNIAGTKFDLMDGIFGLSLGPVLPGNNRELHYFSLASYQQYKVNTKILRDKTLAANTDNYKCTIYTRPNQSGGGVIDKRGVFFFSLLTDNAIGCWNTYKSPSPRNVETIAKDDYRLQFVLNFNLDEKGGIWLLASSAQKGSTNTLSQTDPNFRVFYAPSTDALVRGTRCASDYNSNYYYPASTSNEIGICY